ncbi:Putative LOC100197594 [Caligus rogercresseyi]|uniref:LOC100197594 n=1 Tax=Caligus rogercresseyi TaxID=217165 RepID=A0A7T8KBS2_CALRO|nr:Putative LOC100197594 [Caligus rogercresseyi]
MVWVGVTSDGKKAPIIFVEEGVKIDQAVYLHLLSEEVIPWVQREYLTALLLFQ